MDERDSLIYFIDNETIFINNKKLNIYKDKYDWRDDEDTNNKATEYRHDNNPYRKGLEFLPIAKNVSYEAARGLEQMWIIECNTLKRDPQNPIHNQINGVNPLNKEKYYIYWAAASGWVSDNESLVPCR